MVSGILSSFSISTGSMLVESVPTCIAKLTPPKKISSIVYFCLILFFNHFSLNDIASSIESTIAVVSSMF